MRYRKLYPKDMVSATVQQDLNKNLRLGVITDVDSEQGTCTLRWLDKPGFQTDVYLTQGTQKEWHIPEVNSLVLVGFTAKDQAYILRYINLGQAGRVATSKTLPRLQEGEKFWEVGGSYIHMRANGDINIATLEGGEITLEASSGTYKSETVNWRLSSEGGSQYLGIVKRPVSNVDGTKSFKLIGVEPGLPSSPTNGLTGQYLTEYRLKVVEVADNTVGVDPTVPTLFDIRIGTVVDANGFTVDRLGAPVSTPLGPTALCVKLTITSPLSPLVPLLDLTIDKQGKLDLTVLNNVAVTSLAQMALKALAQMTLDAPSIILNQGPNGAARLQDTVEVTLTDVEVVSLGLLSTAIGTPISIGPQSVTSVKLRGHITSASNTVKIGN